MPNNKKKPLIFTEEQILQYHNQMYGIKRAAKALGIKPCVYRRHMIAYGLQPHFKEKDRTWFNENMPRCILCKTRKCMKGKVCAHCLGVAAKRGRKLAAIEYKGGCCQECGLMDSVALGFHHRNPDEKLFELSQGIRYLADIELLLKELDKCELLCANCHMKKHERNLDHPEISVKLQEVKDAFLNTLRSNGHVA